MLLIAYAITRHRFLDIRLAAQRTTLYVAVLIGTLALLYAAIFIADRYFHIVGSYAGFALGIVSTALVAGIAFSLWRRFRRYPRVLRNYATLADELQDVANTTLQEYDPKKLLQDLRTDAAEVLPAVSLDLYIWDFTDHVYFSVNEPKQKLDEDSKLISSLYRRRSPLWQSGLRAFAGEFDEYLERALRQQLTQLHADAVLPLFAGSDLIALITLRGIDRPPAHNSTQKLEDLLTDYRQAIVYLLSYQQSIARAKKGIEERG